MSRSQEKLEAIFEAALALETEAQRAAYLTRACPDPEFRREVESLLSSHQPPNAVLAKATIRVELSISEPASDCVGALIGGYRIVRPLGHGGMGTVYEAEELDNGRRVALKVLSQTLDSPVSRQRFLREGLLAASVNHPNTVYVFGTEEIDGQPVIAMELVNGGTLQDRVQQNKPMAVSDAVDAILQVIAGLEAAASLGVLHRDIKPSNCFVETDGTVKVGDFGLSISSAATAESKLTMTGSFLGTPAYSPPEQLRGDEFTLQGDIYAVGVTLYYLLTGRTPFEGENLVRMLATVLERPAESPALSRPEIPGELCRTVLRCLEKQPSKRFKNYAELRNALLPYSSTASTPATLSLRFLAGCIDWALLLAVYPSLALLSTGHWDALLHDEFYPGTRLFNSIFSAVLIVLYFTVLEGIWGASLGKRICGLRVIGPNRGLPGLPRAFLRAFLADGLVALPKLLFLSFSLSPQLLGQGALNALETLSTFAWVLGPLLFCTVRQRNGFAAVHDLLTRTRVIRQSAHVARPGLDAIHDHSPTLATAPHLGPYQVIQTLGSTDAGEILVGLDQQLQRKVWILKHYSETPPVATSLRNLSRVGRLRWLNGKRSPGECWDAYEAGPGKTLPDLIAKPQPWSRVRFWLLDLAEELSAAAKDQSLPKVLQPDRVWITADGRAKLLDFPAPQTAGSLPRSEASDSSPEQFLCQVAVAALEGRPTSAVEARTAAVTVPLPPHAQTLLGQLQIGLSPTLLVERLKPLLDRLSFVSIRRRLGLMASCIALPLIVAVIGAVLIVAQPKFVQSYSEALSLGHCLNRLSELNSFANQPGGLPKQERDAFEVYLAGHFRQAITNAATWTSLAGAAISPEQRTEAARLIATRPVPTDQELRQAAEVVEPYLKKSWFGGPATPVASKLWFLVLVVSWTLVLCAAVPTLVAALLLRGGLVLSTMGLQIVRKNGTKASRLRIFWRSVIAWSPLLLLPLLKTRVTVLFGDESLQGALVMCLVLILAACLMAWAALLPNRGLHDRLAGTALIPRE